MSVRSSAYLRKLLAILLALLLAVSVPASASTAKAKVSSTAKYYKSPSTSSGFVYIEKGTVVTVSAVKKGWAKVKYKGVTGYIKTSNLTTAEGASKSSDSDKKSSGSSWKSKVTVESWFDGGSNVLTKGHYGTLLDVKTGISIKIYRMGGHNHADVEPATYADSYKLKSLGSSWDPRPGILHVGNKYVACSFNTMCHGDQTIRDNDYDGQFCLHMLGSRTHGGDVIREDHQEAIQYAYNWAH